MWGCQNVGMQDRELYRQILGIEAPWFVERVELKLAEGEVHIYLEHGEMASWPCPECAASCQLYDHQGERQWRHLDTCQYQTILHARPPRTQCGEHGVRVVKLRWAEPSSRFTALMERLVIDWLRAASQKAVGEQLGLSWDENSRDHGAGGGAGLGAKASRTFATAGSGRESVSERAQVFHVGE